MGATETNTISRNVVRSAPAQTALPGRDPDSSWLWRWYFVFFAVSGACSLVYEVAWVRLAMANFGVTTPMISIVLSVFMAGLGLGSWGGGIFVRRLDKRSAAETLRRYALLELLIGVSGVVVIPLLSWGRLASEHIQNAMGLGSLSLYLVSGLLVTIALLPWCTFMGATVPFVMSAMRKSLGEDRGRSFSFLYLANVLGAVLGTLVPAFVLFELLGFRQTLYVTALLNLLLATTVVLVSRSRSLPRNVTEPSDGNSADCGPVSRPGKGLNLWLVFLTGFVSMALEVIWIRQFTPYLGTVVYTFALILAFYLLATFEGSSAYRAWKRTKSPRKAAKAWILIGACALIPLFSADPRLMKGGFVSAVLLTLLGVAPFSGLAGFLTPMLVDEWCDGDPRRGGKAYGINVLGCILGPLVGGFCLLPWLGVRWGTVLLAVPLFAVGLAAAQRPARFASGTKRSGRELWFAAGVAVVGLALIAGTEGFQGMFHDPMVKRDYTATVIATGTGMKKQLLVNGVGITSLIPATKIMAHLPLALLSHRPRNGLAICFGMGTTFRSMLSWGIPTTGVDLVPSVPKLFGYYFPDGPKLLKSPLAHVVIDDGRRFLERTSGRYSVIAIDPPPPPQAAGSSLLYSREFYALAKKRLRPDGILAQWLPVGGDAATEASVARALRDSFPYILVFRDYINGLHFLASEQPIPLVSAATLAARMPPAARADLVEWGPYATAEKELQWVLSGEIPITKLIAKDPAAPALSDNRPVNEYFFLRRLLPQSWMRGQP